MEILYTSARVHTMVREILSNPMEGDRRVVLVAFVGRRAETFLPHPEGMEIVCWLRPGATDATALSRLKKRGAKIYKSKNLHMKVYWSSRKGCVITSANASARALARKGLKEAGIWLPAGAVDIERLLSEARPQLASDHDLLRLAKEQPVPYPPEDDGDGADMEPERTFLEWMELWRKYPDEFGWKLGWWDNKKASFGGNTIRAGKNAHGVPEPLYSVEVKDGQVGEGEWLLTFNILSGNNPQWMFVDVVADLDTTKDACSPDYPVEVAQARSARLIPDPPFKIDDAFRSAFKKALASYHSTIKVSNTLDVPTGMLERISAQLEGTTPPGQALRSKAIATG